MIPHNDTITLLPQKRLCGSFDIISSKSELHRLIFCACLSKQKTSICYNSSLSKDILATIGVFRSLGAEISFDASNIYIEKPVDIRFLSDGLAENTQIFCNESGSTARFILPLVSMFCKPGTTLTGAGKLPQRPFSDLCRCLEGHGAEFSADSMPISVIRNSDNKGIFEISGNISSQYLSGLLLALPLCGGAKVKLTTPLESAGYVDITIDAMKRFGVDVSFENGIYSVSGSYTCPDAPVRAYGDWSNAAFFMCGANCEKELCISGLDINSKQPDRKIADILSDCGFDIKAEKDTVYIKRGKNIKPIDIDASEIPDLVPVLCVLASTIPGKSTIRNIKRLRFKESDRVLSSTTMINVLGGDATYDDNNIYIDTKTTLSGGKVVSFGDHRIVMSTAVAALFCKGNTEICGFSDVKKSYPDFFDIYNRLLEENV